jgi:Transposase DDE domain
VSTTKSPIQVLQVAHELGRRTFRRHWHKYAPKKFTVPQLFACLVLKEFLRLDYRKLSSLLEEAPTLCRAIGLASVPHFTTLQKAADRLLDTPRVQRLLDRTVAMAQEIGLLGRRSRLAALDGTGLESTTASQYYVRQREKAGKLRLCVTYREFPKIGVLCDCASHLTLAVVHDQGPGPDIKHFRAALDQAHRRLPLETLAADAGYDSEATHVYSRDQRGVRTLIPARIGRPTQKLPKGHWRKVMATRLHRTRYGQRWQVETTISMLKRLLGSQLKARKAAPQRREASLKVLTLNVMIL